MPLSMSMEECEKQFPTTVRKVWQALLPHEGMYTTTAAKKAGLGAGSASGAMTLLYQGGFVTAEKRKGGAHVYRRAEVRSIPKQNLVSRPLKPSESPPIGKKKRSVASLWEELERTLTRTAQDHYRLVQLVQSLREHQPQSGNRELRAMLAQMSQLLKNGT
jgi:hypothetical protein